MNVTRVYCFLIVCFCTALETLYRYAESQSTPVAVEATVTDPLPRAFGLHSAHYSRQVEKARAKWTAGGAREPRPKKLLYVRSGILKREREKKKTLANGVCRDCESIDQISREKL